MSRRRDGIRKAVVATALAGLVLSSSSSSAFAPPSLVSAILSGTNGVSVVQAGGETCMGAGNVHYRHVTFSSPLPTFDPIISAALPGTMTGFFNVGRTGDEPVNTPLPAGQKAFLHGTDSTVTLTNQRGSVMLRLQGGTCLTPNFDFDGFTISGTHVWTVDAAGTTGSYHPLAANPTTGSGTYNVSLGIRPNHNNPWQLGLAGNLTVPQPVLKVAVAKTKFVGLSDLFKRILTVTYRVTNAGPGDSFAPVLTGAPALHPGVTVMGPVPQTLPDLLHGKSTLVSVRYKLARPGPCGFRCIFDTSVSVAMPDAFDNVDGSAPPVVAHVKYPF